MIWRTLATIAATLAALILPAQAQFDSDHFAQELANANGLLNGGHVTDGVKLLQNLRHEIDPTKNKEAYWRASILLTEYLSQTENHPLASQVIHELIATKITEGQTAYFQWMQFYLGRNLAYTGKADEGEKVLRALTAGDQRLVLIPAQRAAALMLSTIELDKGNIEQSAIWMRRAVIGTLVDKRAGSEEIIDTLTSYANYLTRTRNYVEADLLFRKLVPIYDKYYPHYGSKYLRVASEYLNNLSSLGNFSEADRVLKVLKDNVANVDVVANSVREEMFFQELYQLARTPLASTGPNPLIVRLKDVVSKFPDFLKQPRNRIVFSYFSLVAGDVDLADEYNSPVENSASLDDEFSAYEIIIKSFIAADRGKIDQSVAFAREALDRIRIFHRRFENESASRLPAISIEERLILSLILGVDASHISSFDQADVLFQLEQYLTRDKGKLGLNARVALQTLKSDLQREDIRSRDRLQSLRDKMMEKATDTLIVRALPIREFSPEQKNDYAALGQLEEIEDRILVSDEHLQKSAPQFLNDSADSPVDLGTIQRLIKPDEALVMHIFAGAQGFVTTCIDSNNWTFNVKRLDPSEIRQLDIDYKLLLAAVHVTEAPSAEINSGFPFKSAFHLYQSFFGGIEKCLQGKTHILLATDPDFFSLPWNALITNAPLESQKTSNKGAPWVPKKYAISLLPSVRSLFQLRVNLPPSAAREKFLGVGAPDFKGAPDRSKKISLAPLFVARGAGNRGAIENLPALPETAEELRAVAKALGTSESHILLGREATERELRKQALNEYRVISFATHAVVAGDIEGITEPALVLSPGLDDHDENNDGLLTETEIANLTLDANLVILSACNTAASDGRAGGRGLSGLADAFFFAGARSIAVTQWPVFSDSAKQLGVGLISHSRSSGVAEGLRQTMVDYISNVKEDYLANPRFWAAFIIAGDGAVRPLDVQKITDEKPIKVDWGYLSSNIADDEISGLATGPHSAFAVGIQKPPIGEKRAGSYFIEIRPNKNNVSVIARDSEMAASGVVSFGTKIGLLGYYPSDNKSSAVFRMLDQNDQERWRYIVASDLWNYPVGIVQTADGYILISLETDLSPLGRASTLVLNVVSASGAALKRQTIPIPLLRGFAQPKNVAIDSRGNLIVAISGSEVSPPQSAMWTNPRTGSKHYCVGRRLNSTALLSIGVESLELQSKKILEGDQVVSIRQYDGHVYGAINFATNCRLETNIRLVEIGPQFELKTIFQTNNVNSVDVKDVMITADNYLLVGGVQIFLPTALQNKTITLEELKQYTAPNVWDDSFWEKNAAHSGAFVIALRKDGTLVADRVFPDLRYRSISNVAQMAPNHFLAVGNAFGDRGWIFAFSLPEPSSSLWYSVLSPLRRLFGSSGKPN